MTPRSRCLRAARLASNRFVVDRIQTGGVSNLNIPQEKIYELGNYKTVATIRDIPDLTFEVESLDVYPEFEAILTGQDPTSISDGDEFDFTDAKPIDIISPFKQATGLFNIVKGIAIPYLTLESATYRFGNRQNATKQFSMRGDAVYYIPGTPYYSESRVTPRTLRVRPHTALDYEEPRDSFLVGARFLLLDQISERQLSAQAELSAEPEWADDNYLQGLHDAWSDRLAETHSMNPKDPEAAHVFAELKRFSEKVDALVELEREGMRRDFEQGSDAELRPRRLGGRTRGSALSEAMTTK